MYIRIQRLLIDHRTFLESAFHSYVSNKASFKNRNVGNKTEDFIKPVITWNWPRTKKGNSLRIQRLLIESAVIHTFLTMAVSLKRVEVGAITCCPSPRLVQLGGGGGGELLFAQSAYRSRHRHSRGAALALTSHFAFIRRNAPLVDDCLRRKYFVPGQANNNVGLRAKCRLSRN